MLNRERLQTSVSLYMTKTSPPRNVGKRLDSTVIILIINNIINIIIVNIIIAIAVTLLFFL